MSWLYTRNDSSISITYTVLFNIDTSAENPAALATRSAFSDEDFLVSEVPSIWGPSLFSPFLLFLLFFFYQAERNPSVLIHRVYCMRSAYSSKQDVVFLVLELQCVRGAFLLLILEVDWLLFNNRSSDKLVNEKKETQMRNLTSKRSAWLYVSARQSPSLMPLIG